MYKISDAAKISGLPSKTIRYYEEIGLVEASGRSSSGYRVYDQAALRKLGFVKRSREFGFSIEECRELLKLFENQNRASADVKSIASARLAEIEEKQRLLQSLHDDLAALIHLCQGDENADCAILEALS